MRRKLFGLIQEIARRNGSIEYYPLEEFKDEGELWLTSECWRSPEVASEWLFSDVSDAEARTLLRAFVGNEDRCTFDVRRHLARLLATKGGLVRDLMDPLLDSTDWGSYAAPQLLLAYLAVKADGVDWMLRLLDIVPNDARDGLFTACWHCEDLKVQEKLLAKFEEWTKDPGWGGGDGEDAWMKDFIAKWIAKEYFSYERLKNLVCWHFKDKFRFLSL